MALLGFEPRRSDSKLILLLWVKFCGSGIQTESGGLDLELPMALSSVPQRYSAGGWTELEAPRPTCWQLGRAG